MLRNTSIPTINSPEFIEVTPQNDLISKCEIKVLYLGENRNHSFITKEVAKEMANSLPGAPIVGAFIESKEDFGDHGRVVTIEDGQIKFSCKTVPYGFVAPDAEVWFQEFLDTDEYGVQTKREYLMTTGYLWTGQYPEVQKAIDEGLPQSMELEEDTLDGHWATNGNSGVEFFIINDATFSKLCILGSDVEPCFEGASVTAPTISNEFSKEPEFVFTLLKMRNELENALYNEGGSDMLKNEEQVEETVEAPITEFEDAGDAGTDAGDSTDSTESDTDAADEGAEDGAESDSTEESDSEETDAPAQEEPEEEESEEEDSEEEEVTPSSLIDDNGDGASMKKRQDFVKQDEEEEKDESDSADDSAEDSEGSSDDEDKKKKPSNDHSLEQVEAEFAAVKAELDSVKAELETANVELESLRSFKLGIENSKKEELIAKYHMLSDEVRSELMENKSKYSYEEIEAKLALAYVKEFADFETVDGKPSNEVEVEDSPITTFSLDSAVEMTSGATGFVATLLANRE